MTGLIVKLSLAFWMLTGVVVSCAAAAAPVIPDIEVIDQDGQAHRLYTDLVKGKTVAITFLYTSCKTSCPAMTGLFGAVQQKLQGGAHPSVTLLSISIDPTTDRPTRLKSVADKFGAQPGWYFLTGSSPDMARLLSALNATAPQRSDHPSMILIGNDVNGNWTRHYGLASVPLVMELVDSVGESIVH